MIRHAAHADIDRGAWDALLKQCPGRLWYARSRVLDRTGPWDALIDEEAGAIMPLPYRVKWGIPYLYNPYGLQQLGVFAQEPSKALATAFIHAIPHRFRYVDIWVNADTEASVTTGRFEARTDQILRCDQDMETLRAHYSQGHRRNLRKNTEVPIDHTMTIDAFIGLFERTTGARFGGSPRGSLAPLRGIIADAVEEGIGELACVRMDGVPVAAACFITWEGRSILLKTANDARGQEVRAMFHLVDRWIAQHAGSGMLLDFAGSNTASVARFNAGFGAVPSTYFRFRQNRLPWPLLHLKPRP